MPNSVSSTALGPMRETSTDPSILYLAQMPGHDEDAIWRADISRNADRSLDRSVAEIDTARSLESMSIAALRILVDHFRPRNVVRIQACTARSSVVSCRPTSRAMPRCPLFKARCTVRGATPATRAAPATVISIHITSHERHIVST